VKVKMQTCVNATVVFQVAGSGERFAAVFSLTDKRFLPGVGPHMHAQTLGRQKPLVAGRTYMTPVVPVTNKIKK
jgi:hypothetical protein